MTHHDHPTAFARRPPCCTKLLDVETSEHLRILKEEGIALAAAATRAGLDAAIPSCPRWCVGDLVAHVGTVHRWATAHVVEKSPVLLKPDEGPDRGLGEEALLAWYDTGLSTLLDVLGSADADVECFTFLPSPSPLAFWARRQAHETAIHRADAAQAADMEVSYEPDFAADGVDELLIGFGGRGRNDAPVSRRHTIAVAATDTGDSWGIVLEGETMITKRASTDAGCSVVGQARDLYLLLWNRADPAHGSLTVEGDASSLQAWREAMKVTWR